MWIYAPKPSTTSASAPEAEDSTSALNWQFRVLAQSVWLRGKPSPSPIWYRRWKKELWLQRLCGAMSEPSMAALGVAEWTESLVASRANLIQSQDYGSAKTMTEISGAMPDGSSSKPGRGSSSLRTSAACSRLAGSSGFGETFSDLVSRLSQDCSRRRRLARRMTASASLSSQWQTPAIDNFNTRGGDRKDEEGLDQQARLWPTPKATERGADRVRRDTGAPQSDLVTRVAMWPTPDAQLSNDTESTETFLARQEAQRARGINGNGMGTSLAMAAKLWPTPATRDWKGSNGADHLENSTGSLHLDQLPNYVEHLWRTPTVQEPKRGDSPNWTPDPKAGEHSLNRQATQWMTPRVQQGGYTRDKGIEGQERLTLEGQAEFFQPSLPAPVTLMPGEKSSIERRSLNPLFVEWLMGWPAGWTSSGLWHAGSTGFACLETELFLYKQRMRSELLRLGLPSAAPPAQLGLFG